MFHTKVIKLSPLSEVGCQECEEVSFKVALWLQALPSCEIVYCLLGDLLSRWLLDPHRNVNNKLFIPCSFTGLPARTLHYTALSHSSSMFFMQQGNFV